MADTRPIIPPATSIDIDALIETFAANAKPWQAESMHEHIESLGGRMAGAYGDAAVQLLRRAGYDGVDLDGVRIKRLPTSDEWTMAGTIAAPGVEEIGVVVKIDKPYTARASLATQAWIADAKKNPVPAIGTPERDAWEQATLDRAVAAGLPLDLPPAEECDGFDEVGFYRFGGHSGGPKELAATCTTERFYWSDRILEGSRVRAPYEGQVYGTIRAEVDPTDWRLASRAMRAACHALGLQRMVVDRTVELGAVHARHYCSTEDNSTTLESIGAGMAILDAGFPDKVASEKAATLEGHSMLIKLLPRIGEMATIVDYANRNGQHDLESARDYNDMRIHAWSEPQDDGSVVLRISYNRELAVLIEGPLHAPTSITLWDQRAQAKPSPDEAGWLGRYRLGDDPTIEIPPTFGTQEIKASNTLVAAIENCAIEILEDDPAPAP